MARRATYAGIVFAVAAAVAGSLEAARPAASLLPATTVGYFSVPDVDALRTKWNATDLGKLLKDPLMQPFVEDLEAQLKKKLDQTGTRIGIELEDLEGTYGGEVCLGVIQPNGKPTEHALILIVDVTGKTAQAQALIDKVAGNLRQKGAQRSTEKIAGVDVVVFKLPKLAGAPHPTEARYFIHETQLFATDHKQVAESMIARLTGKSKVPSLAERPGFVKAMEHCEAGGAEGQPHVRWFVDPFNYLEVIRAAAGGRKKRGTDLLKILESQGFDAVQGVGGVVTFADGTHEILHRTFVYAPPQQAAKPDSYRLAARMLNFPNRGDLPPEPWVPANLASYMSFNWKMKEAFEYSKTLVNEIAGDEVFEDILNGILQDPQGPMVDIRKDLVRHLGERATMITDSVLPITPKSERMLIAIDVTNPAIVKRTIDKAMQKDPDAKARKSGNHIIWEILSEEQEVEVRALQIEGIGGGDDEEEEEEEEEAKPVLPNSAITVTGAGDHGYLIVSTHVEFIAEVLKDWNNPQPLLAAADHQALDLALRNLGGDGRSFRVFSRSDEAYRATYELIRQGKMPQAESFLGRVLNRFLGPDQPGVQRKQVIDGSKMPEFDKVKKYLGPGGAFANSMDDGWLITGCLLAK